MSDRRKTGQRNAMTTEERIVKLYKAIRGSESRRRARNEGYRQHTIHMEIARRLKMPCQEVRQIIAKNRSSFYLWQWNDGRKRMGLTPVELKSTVKP